MVAIIRMYFVLTWLRCSLLVLPNFCVLMYMISSIKDGAVREYEFRDRSLQGLKDFVEEAKWRNVDPIPWFWSPTSPQ